MKNNKLINIKLTDLRPPKYNPRRKSETDGDEVFKDLVASVKEKGVLQPVLVRFMVVGGKYEVIAGNRRLAAAKEAGLEEIPAKVVEMTDEEAAEAAIVENLQRADVHPLEEGEAYRRLIEDGGRKISDVAVKVGKGEAYVRQRLFLTNLVPAGKGMYRKGQVKDAVAYELARLAPADQEIAIKEALGPGWMRENASRFREWVNEHVNADLSFQPWLHDRKIADAVGPCTECPANRETLFGKVKEGQCVSRNCWARKMGKYVEYLKKKEPTLVPIADSYGDALKGILSRSQYEEIPAKEKKCTHARPAIVVSGKGIGRRRTVCVSKGCAKHGWRHSETETALTPAELKKRKETRRKANAAAAAKERRGRKAVEKLAARATWPMKERAVDAFFELALQKNGTDTIRPIVKYKGWKVEKKKAAYQSAFLDYEGALRREAKKMTTAKRFELAWEIFLSGIWNAKKVAKFL